MNKQEMPPAYNPNYNHHAPQAPPPSYSMAINGCDAANPLTPQQPILTAQHIVTTGNYASYIFSCLNES